MGTVRMKVIKTQTEYEAALNEIDELLAQDPEAGSDEANALDVLAVLVEEYENRTVDLGRPESQPHGRL